MRRTKEEAEETKRQLLKAALSVFKDKGYSRTKLEDIANAAGLSRGAVYWHFSNKFNLYASLIEECHSEIKKRIEGILCSVEPAMVLLMKFIKEYLISLENDEKYREKYAYLGSVTVEEEVRAAERAEIDVTVEWYYD